MSKVNVVAYSIVLFGLWNICAALSNGPGGTLYFKLRKYDNVQNILSDYTHCNNGNDCDPIFTIRVKNAATSVSLIDVTTAVYRKQKTIRFGKDLPNSADAILKNPLTAEMQQLPLSIYIDIVANDYSVDRTNPKIAEFIEREVTLMKPFKSAEEIRDDDQDKYDYNRHLPSTPSAVNFWVDIWTQCNVDYYGQACTKKCQAMRGVSLCDEQGNLRCVESTQKPPCSSAGSNMSHLSTAQVSSTTITALSHRLPNSSSSQQPISSKAVTASISSPTTSTSSMINSSSSTISRTIINVFTASSKKPQHPSIATNPNTTLQLVTTSPTTVKQQQTNSSITVAAAIPTTSAHVKVHDLILTATSVPFLIVIAGIIILFIVLVIIITVVVQKMCSSRRRQPLNRSKSMKSNSTAVTYDGSVHIPDSGRLESTIYESTEENSGSGDRCHSFVNSGTYQPLLFAETNEYELPKTNEYPTNSRPLPATPGAATNPTDGTLPNPYQYPQKVATTSPNSHSYSHLSKSYTRPKK